MFISEIFPNDLLTEAKSLLKKVRIVQGNSKGKTGMIRQIKHGLFKGAPKRYDIDLDDGGQENGLPAAALRLIKDASLKKTAMIYLMAKKLDNSISINYPKKYKMLCVQD